MRKRIIALIVMSVLVISMLSGCGNGNIKDGESTNTVCIGVQPSAAFIPLFIARHTGELEKALKEQGVNVIWFDFQSGPPMNTSIAKAETDLCVYGDVPTVSSIEQGSVREVVGITAQAADSYAIVVPKNSTINSPQDLKGKKVATVLGSTSHNMLDKYLASGGMTFDDIELVSGTVSSMPDMLESGQVDAISLWEPGVTKLTDSGNYRILAQGSDCGLEGTNTIVGRESYCEVNPKVVETILKEYKKAADNIPYTSDDTWEYVADYLGLDVSQVKSMLPKYNYSVAITSQDIESLNDTIKFLVKIGKLPKEYNISKYCNCKYYNGEYHRRKN